MEERENMMRDNKYLSFLRQWSKVRQWYKETSESSMRVGCCCTEFVLWNQQDIERTNGRIQEETRIILATVIGNGTKLSQTKRLPSE